MIEKLYTVEEVAELASVTGRTIRNYLKSGRLLGRKIGGQWRFPEAEVQRLLSGAPPEALEAETPMHKRDASGVAELAEYAYEGNWNEPAYEGEAAFPAAAPQPESYAAVYAPLTGAPVSGPTVPQSPYQPATEPTPVPPPFYNPGAYEPPPVPQAAAYIPAYSPAPAFAAPGPLPTPQAAAIPAMPPPYEPAPYYSEPPATPVLPQPPAPEPLIPYAMTVQPTIPTPALRSPSASGYYEGVPPAAPQAAPYATTPAFAPQPPPPAPAAHTEDEPLQELLSGFSDVGGKVARFVAEVHDASSGPVMCTVMDANQPLAAARMNSERLSEIAEEESGQGALCQCFVEYDDRYSVARYTLFGTSSFLLRCITLIG